MHITYKGLMVIGDSDRPTLILECDADFDALWDKLLDYSFDFVRDKTPHTALLF